MTKQEKQLLRMQQLTHKIDAAMLSAMESLYFWHGSVQLVSDEWIVTKV